MAAAPADAAGTCPARPRFSAPRRCSRAHRHASCSAPARGGGYAPMHQDGTSRRNGPAPQESRAVAPDCRFRDTVGRPRAPRPTAGGLPPAADPARLLLGDAGLPSAFMPVDSVGFTGGPRPDVTRGDRSDALQLVEAIGAGITGWLPVQDRQSPAVTAPAGVLPAGRTPGPAPRPATKPGTSDPQHGTLLQGRRRERLRPRRVLSGPSSTYGACGQLSGGSCLHASVAGTELAGQARTLGTDAGQPRSASRKPLLAVEQALHHGPGPARGLAVVLHQVLRAVRRVAEHRATAASSAGSAGSASDGPAADQHHGVPDPGGQPPRRAQHRRVLAASPARRPRPRPARPGCGWCAAPAPRGRAGAGAAAPPTRRRRARPGPA